MTREEMAKYVYEPNLVQQYILKEIEKFHNGEVILSDPTNPFNLLLEATASSAANAIIETNSIIRKKYPILATSPDELYHHISDDQMANMISQPGSALICFYVNILDLKLNGYTPNNANYKETTIPIGTEISILGYTFTLLNDIIVRLYDNSTIFVEQQVNDNEIAYQDTGILEHVITHDSNGNPYILFETRVKQVKKISRNIAVTPSSGFVNIVNLSDTYYYSEVKYKNSSTNNEYKYIPKSFSDEYIDPLNPTCYVAIYDKSIQFKIPDVYLLEKMISGTIQIDVYETKGKVYLPINKYKNDDFTITLGDTTKSPSAATSPNILIWGNSRGVLEGGVNSLSLLELRESIINNTTGDIDLPITSKMLDRYCNMYGYTINKVQDTITGRKYIGLKPLPIEEFKSELLYSTQDIISGQVQFSIEELDTSKFGIVLTNRSIIKSNSIFRNLNGKVILVENDEANALEDLNNQDLIEKCKNVKYYYNPFYYIIDHNELESNVRIYDLDNPIITNNKILSKNSVFNHRVNLRQYGIFKTNTGYRIYFNTATNEDYQKLEKRYIGFQVRLLLNNNITYAYFDAVYDENNDAWYVDIQTSINMETNNSLDLQNGDSDLYTKRFDLTTHMEIYSYCTDPALLDETHFLRNEIWLFNPNSNYVIFTKERIDVTFGEHLDYLWNKIYALYTERKYLKYEKDIPMLYEKDIYARGELDNIFTVVNGKLNYTILHHKGDPVLDENNNPIIKHKKGDSILDENNQPTIDTFGGVIRFMDVLLFEYEYKRATASTYTRYKELMLKVLKTYLTDELKTINNILLEKTSVMYKPNKTIQDTIVNINNVLYSTNYLVSPNITLYSNSVNRYTVEELDNMKFKIGNILNYEFNKDKVTLYNIREAIKKELGENISSVKITNIEPSNSEVLLVVNNTNKFVLDKILELNLNNELVVKNNITIDVIYLN